MEVPGAHTFVTTGGLVVHNCFPKDVTALKQLAGNAGYPFLLLQAVWEVNELQKRRVVGKLQKHLGPLRGKTVALLGLAFKPNTDDMREAPSRVIAYRLLAEGAEVRAWDPVARPDDLQGVELCDTVLDAVRNADAAVIVTEWPELRSLDLAGGARGDGASGDRGRSQPARPGIAHAAGFVYEAVGRPRYASPAEPAGVPRSVRSFAADGGAAPRRRQGGAAGRGGAGPSEAARPGGRASARRVHGRPARRRRRDPHRRRLPGRAGGGLRRRARRPRRRDRAGRRVRSPSAAAAAAARGLAAPRGRAGARAERRRAARRRLPGPLRRARRLRRGRDDRRRAGVLALRRRRPAAGRRRSPASRRRRSCTTG